MRGDMLPRMRPVAAGSVAAFLFAIAGVVFTPSCGETECVNGECVCPAGSSCDFTCDAPPCHVNCGEASECTGVCANGQCTCNQNATCDFECAAPPCHVDCRKNDDCSGTCSNGTCTCGPDSKCDFKCASGPCHSVCKEGATCLVECPNAGVTGTQDCDISECAAGTPTVCPDGIHIACGVPCP